MSRKINYYVNLFIKIRQKNIDKRHNINYNVNIVSKKLTIMLIFLSDIKSVIRFHFCYFDKKMSKKDALSTKKQALLKPHIYRRGEVTFIIRREFIGDTSSTAERVVTLLLDAMDKKKRK